MISLFGLDPGDWEPHALHSADRAYAETNCYADVMIELIAAAGHEPEAALGITAAMDFEQDQWTFFKPAQEDMFSLYGMDLHEMQPSRNLAEQAAERLTLGQTLVPELDSFWLPDTAATSYRTEHVKTSVVVEAIDVDEEILRYFHNGGYYELSGEDYRHALGVVAGPPERLPPYTELVRLDAGPTPADPRAVARRILLGYLRRRPADNPFDRFGVRLDQDLPRLIEKDLARFHEYAFANVRMAGAGFGLLAAHVDWLFGAAAAPVGSALEEIVDYSKVLLFRLARRRSFEVEDHVAPMREAWTRAMSGLQDLAAR